MDTEKRRKEGREKGREGEREINAPEIPGTMKPTQESQI